MKLIHESNILKKIKDNYKNKGSLLKTFYDTIYSPYKQKMESEIFDENNPNSFIVAANLISDYYASANDFANKNDITSQSKFLSTIIEEISYFLFKDLDEIKTNKYQIYNSGVFAGLTFNENDEIVINKKDVDFCIGRILKININKKEYKIRKPIIAVEVKTYLDATMFSGIRTFSSDLKIGSIDCQTYVLMGYKSLKREHILYAKGSTDLNEMFALCEDSSFKIKSDVLFDYWKEIKEAIANYKNDSSVPKYGRLLKK